MIGNETLQDQDYFRFRKHFGVNLGAWLILERWMEDDLFHGLDGSQDEYTLQTEASKKEELQKRRAKHLTNYISDDALDEIQKLGANAVRLPIGYWCLGDKKVVKGTPWEKLWEKSFTFNHEGQPKTLWELIVDLIKRCEKRDIGVLVQLHGAPGSQNGHDHSGHIKPPDLFEKKEHHQAWHKALEYLAVELKKFPNVIGLAILNEPGNHPKVEELSLKAIEDIRKKDSEIPIYISDIWAPDHWIGILKSKNWMKPEVHGKRQGPILLDHHYYRCHDPRDWKKTSQEHKGDVTGPTPQSNMTGSSWRQFEEYDKRANEDSPKFIIGEWAGALHDAGKEDEASFALGQYRMFSQVTAGHFYWSYKVRYEGKAKESTNSWSWREMMKFKNLRTPYAPQRNTRDVNWLESNNFKVVDHFASQHGNYWKKQDCTIYRKGMEQGFKDTIAFATRGDRGSILVLSSFLIHWRAPAEAHKTGALWEFRDGYVKANQTVLKYCFDWPVCLIVDPSKPGIEGKPLGIEDLIN